MVSTLDSPKGLRSESRKVLVKATTMVETKDAAMERPMENARFAPMVVGTVHSTDYSMVKSTGIDLKMPMTREKREWLDGLPLSCPRLVAMVV